MKIALLMIIFVAMFCCSGCITDHYANHGFTYKSTDFKPSWILMNTNKEVAVEGVCAEVNTNVTSFIMLGRLDVPIYPFTSKQEAYTDILQYLLSHDYLTYDQKTVDKIDSDYARIGPYIPRSGHPVISVNPQKEKYDNPWNMLWTVPADIVTCPIQFILLLIYMPSC